MKTVNDPLARLASLIGTARSCEQDLRRASRHSGDAHLKNLLQLYADDYARALAELQQCARDAGGEGPAMDSVAVVGMAFDHDGDLGVLEECERIERRAHLLYQQAMATRPAPKEGALLQRQSECVAAHLTRIRQLRALYAVA